MFVCGFIPKYNWYQDILVSDFSIAFEKGIVSMFAVFKQWGRSILHAYVFQLSCKLTLNHFNLSVMKRKEIRQITCILYPFHAEEMCLTLIKGQI